MTRCAPQVSISASERSKLLLAGAEVLDVVQTLQRKGRNVVTEVLGEDQPMRQWQHYPADDATDLVSGYRWYYHAHPDATALGEHGHFHVFAAASPGAGYTHLLGLSMSESGMPLRGFTTNRWVTNEIYAPAGRVLKSLRQFAMSEPTPMTLVHRWLAATLRLFRPQIAWLLATRDQRLMAARATRPNVFEDRRTTLLSQCSFELQAQFAWLESSGPMTIQTGVSR